MFGRYQGASRQHDVHINSNIPLCLCLYSRHNIAYHISHIYVANIPHLRDLLEQGFEVAVAKDATAAPRHPEWGYGYTAALINFAFLAHAVMTTDDVVKAMK